ncbi:MAG TPA: SRPBCC family protein [Burkholderiaceae bacterium]|jgi:hypothetical protein|nr:SRPBCC family protein [Burkholderiaceae bacterium]
MLEIIVIAVVVIIAVVLALAARKPDIFRVERSIDIKAAPDKFSSLIDDFHQWAGWSPWEKLDPAMTRAYSGATSGKGAIYEWQGNSKVGQGRMEILEILPNAKIVIKLDFLKPFEAHNTAEFTLETRGDSTFVTWAMYGPASLPVKVMHLFFNMDKMVGKDFETGLANMKALTEK